MKTRTYKALGLGLLSCAALLACADENSGRADTGFPEPLRVSASDEATLIREATEAQLDGVCTAYREQLAISAPLGHRAWCEFWALDPEEAEGLDCDDAVDVCIEDGKDAAPWACEIEPSEFSSTCDKTLGDLLGCLDGLVELYYHVEDTSCAAAADPEELSDAARRRAVLAQFDDSKLESLCPELAGCFD